VGGLVAESKPNAERECENSTSGKAEVHADTYAEEGDLQDTL